MGCNWRSAIRGIAVVGILLLFSCAVRADVIDWNQDPTPRTLAEVMDSDGFLVGDKLFTEFNVISSGNATYKPSAGDITISGATLNNGEVGILLNAGWFALTGEVVDTMISYAVEVGGNVRNLISDNTLIISGVNVNADSPNAVVLAVENVYAGALPQSTSIADKLTYKTSTEEILSDHQIFHNESGEAIALKKVWVVKDLTLFGGTGEPGAVGAALSAVYQTFSQTEVPEPQSFVLLACGAVALLVWRRRRT